MFIIYFKAGINSGYQEKLCLDPEDPDCPETAPNKKTKKVSFICNSNYFFK